MDVIYYTYPWAFNIQGGGERQMMAYRQHLQKWGIFPSLFDMWKPNFKSGAVFHCFSVMPSVLDVFSYAKSCGMRLVVSPNLWVTRDSIYEYPFKSIWNMFELADFVVVNSEQEANALSDAFGFSRDKFRVVYNAAEADFVFPENPEIFRQAFGVRGPFVLNVANVEPRKNQLLFLRALRQERPDLTLVVIGAVRDPEYAAACQEVGGGHFVVVEPQPYASPMIRSALNGCEFFAMPSLLETPSISAIEAAVAGVKVLLTEVGSTTEYFSNSVTLVEPNSLSSLASGISRIEHAQADGATWAARDRYIWPKVVPSLVEVYRSLQVSHK